MTVSTLCIYEHSSQSHPGQIDITEKHTRDCVTARFQSKDWSNDGATRQRIVLTTNELRFVRVRGWGETGTFFSLFSSRSLSNVRTVPTHDPRA